MRRWGYARLLLFTGVFVWAGCTDVAVKLSSGGFKGQANLVRAEGAALRPGEVEDYLEAYSGEKLRYVAYRTLEKSRDRLRARNERWRPQDILAVLQASRKNLSASYRPLRKLAAEQRVWARIEAFEPDTLDALLTGPMAARVVEWIVDDTRAGRPPIEGHMSSRDWTALQRWAVDRLPTTRHVLRWTFEHNPDPTHLAGFLEGDWSDQELVEVMRMWCTSENGSPLSEAQLRPNHDRVAINQAFDRLGRSLDPLVRREANRWARHAGLAMVSTRR